MNKKLVLGGAAVICALELAASGTFMLFMDRTNIATNVFTFGKSFAGKMQETGWRDSDYDGVMDYADPTIAQPSSSDDYWTYTHPGKDSDSPYGQPASNDDPAPLGYQDINTSGVQKGGIPPFNGIDYPNTLADGSIIYKAPRVVHEFGAAVWLRVLARVVVYDGNWNMLTGTALQDELFNQYFGYEVSDDRYVQTYALYRPVFLEPLGTLPTNNNILRNHYAGDDSKVIGGNHNDRWDTLGEYFAGIFYNANFNQKNWEFVPLDSTSTTPQLEGIFYYVSSADNNAVLTDGDGHLALTDSTTNTSNGYNNGSLAVFTGTNHATAPLFTQIESPDITGFMRELIGDNYKIALQFQAQMVQADSNGPIDGSGDWATYFAGMNDRIEVIPNEFE